MCVFTTIKQTNKKQWSKVHGNPKLMSKLGFKVVTSIPENA